MPRPLLAQRFFLALILAATQGALAASQPRDPTGVWVLTLGKRTLLVLSIQPAAGPHQAISGSFSRPQHFRTSDSYTFSHITGPTETEPIVSSVWRGDLLALTVQNPSDPSDKDTYLLRLQDDFHAQLLLDGIPMPPMSLTRSPTLVSVSSDWDPTRSYSPEDDLPSNPEMKRIFDEDQKARAPGFHIDWSVVSKTDAERRQATMKLLQEGALHTGEDFTWAAFVFQHGSTPDDYLLAHTLAMIAVKKGYGDALWICAATLDRYLQSIKQPQIYGTQFLTPDDHPTTQEPYNRTLISDALRRELGVPALVAQEAQRHQYDVERGLSK